MQSKKMNFLSVLKSELATTNLFKSIPGNLLLIPLNILTDFKFSCPCTKHWNIGMAFIVFIAPALLVFALTLISLLKFNVRGNNKQRARGDVKAEEKGYNICVYVSISLFPFLMWIIMLLIDGDYVACSQTNWEGQYSYDNKLQIKWCKPTELMSVKDEAQLQNQILQYIRNSQLAGYIILFILGIILSFVACICCKAEDQGDGNSSGV